MRCGYQGSIMRSPFVFLVLHAAALAAAAACGQTPNLDSQGLTGYIGMDVAAPPDGYGYGVSLYAAAWPLLARPLRDFQVGLASIWIVPDNRDVNYPLLPKGTVARDNWPERGPSYRDVFQTIEGGLGFWASTRFASTTPKFRMNGTANGYNEEISSPGWGFGNTTALTAAQMGIAQLSSRILVPPDGITLRSGTNGDLLGYAWMALPLVQSKGSTAGLPVSTGCQCWTLFLNARNFRGPVAFYTPATWSRVSRRYPPAVGRGLDTRQGLVTGGAIEVNTVPRFVSEAGDGPTYSRIPRLQFPVDPDRRTLLVRDLTQYSRAALYDQVARWVAGGAAPSGRFDAAGALVPRVTARPLSLRQGAPSMPIRGLEASVETRAFDASAFGLQWKPEAVGRQGDGQPMAALPEFFRQTGNGIEAVAGAAAPESSGLAAARFPPAVSTDSYTSPSRGDNCWYRPGPKAGPFHANLADGSVVTYYWYRFVDQPSLQDADLDAAERARLQRVVEAIQAAWTPDRQYMSPPRAGHVAALDRALLVTPPPGLEVGCVPIVTEQSPASGAAPGAAMR